MAVGDPSPCSHASNLARSTHNIPFAQHSYRARTSETPGARRARRARAADLLPAHRHSARAAATHTVRLPRFTRAHMQLQLPSSSIKTPQEAPTRSLAAQKGKE